MHFFFDKKGLWAWKVNGVTAKHSTQGSIISNETDQEVNLFCLKPIHYIKQFMNITFNGTLLKGTGVELRFYNRYKEFLGEAELNAFTTLPRKSPQMKVILVVLRIKPHTSFRLEALEYNFSDTLDERFFEGMDKSTLIVTPSYPSDWNRYFGGFVHSRVVEYQKAHADFSLACIHQYQTISVYDFENVHVLKGDFALLNDLLYKRSYEKILVHFFDEKYSKVLDHFDFSNTQMYFWVHGPETLYWDWNHFVTPYFTQVPEVNIDYKVWFEEKDQIIKRYNDMPNVHWVFVSDWIRKHSEKLIDIQFKHWSVIPNIIDAENFNYVPKNPEQRKKIFCIRRFDDVNKYAIDINVRTILALSHKDFFDDLEFHIYGEGGAYDKLVEPIKDFPNVHFYKQFLTHEQIAQVHKDYGIGLFATRYDAQGVSMCEAAMSGLVIVGSNLDAIREFIPEEYHTLSDMEDYRSFADVIERLYYNPDEFQKISEGMARAMREKCSFERTVQKELDLISAPVSIEIPEYDRVDPYQQPLLSVIIPSYNVQQFIRGTIHSLISHRMAHKMEILIVNDGSKDDTSAIAHSLAQLAEQRQNTTIRVIDKENGGHGSTINVGIREAKGKYLKIVDGDDTVNSKDLETLISLLETETSDCILCDYSDDILTNPVLYRKYLYLFMEPGYQYELDNLCVGQYGFQYYGPLLATGTYKTDVLQKADFHLTEKAFYVDMEFDAYVALACNTVTYYSLDIYRYRQGSATQSISAASFKRNYKHHETVLFNLLEIYRNISNEQKAHYIMSKLILPMYNSHYIILLEYLKNKKIFLDFERRIKQYPEVYKTPVADAVVKARKCGGRNLHGK